MIAIALALLAATPLENAINLHQEGEYAKARVALNKIVENPAASDDDRIQARLYLASASLALHDRAEAKAQLRAALLARPDLRLDPAIFLPELISLEREVRDELPESKPPPPLPVIQPPASPTVLEPPAPAPSHAATYALAGGALVAGGLGLTLAGLGVADQNALSGHLHAQPVPYTDLPQADAASRASRINGEYVGCAVSLGVAAVLTGVAWAVSR